MPLVAALRSTMEPSVSPSVNELPVVVALHIADVQDAGEVPGSERRQAVKQTHRDRGGVVRGVLVRSEHEGGRPIATRGGCGRRGDWPAPVYPRDAAICMYIDAQSGLRAEVLPALVVEARGHMPRPWIRQRSQCNLPHREQLRRRYGTPGRLRPHGQ